MINVSHLTKLYGPRAAVTNLNFEVKQGEIVGFLGPNGAGKSTTMRLITALMPATAGTVKVAGYDVFDQPLEVKRRIGFLPENPPVYLDMQVEEYLSFAAKLHQVPSESIKKAVHLALEKTSLKDVKGRLIKNLSKGYRQRVGLAQAIVHNPPVLILDEPTVGLDPKQIIEIRELIKSFGGDHTILLSSHILPEVTATCERIIVIDRGQIVAEDTIEGLTLKMSKALVYSLIVKNPSSEGKTALLEIAGVKKIHVDGHKYTLELKADAADIREQIIETAVGKKMGVLEFSGEKMSLEDIFLQLTTVEKTGAHVS